MNARRRLQDKFDSGQIPTPSPPPPPAPPLTQEEEQQQQQQLQQIILPQHPDESQIQQQHQHQQLVALAEFHPQPDAQGVVLQEGTLVLTQGQEQQQQQLDGLISEVAGESSANNKDQLGVVQQQHPQCGEDGSVAVQEGHDSAAAAAEAAVTTQQQQQYSLTSL